MTDGIDARAELDRLIRARGDDYAAISRLLGRNPAYIQQFVRRGTPRRLAEQDRRTLARYFGVEEALLGAPQPQEPPQGLAPARRLRPIPRYAVAASAGPGSAAGDSRAVADLGFSEAWLRRLAPRGGVAALSLIRVEGQSMLPTLGPDDEILVDRGDAADHLRDGIYVLRQGDALHVKRVARDGDRLAIRSDNPAADPFLFDPADPPDVIGRVVWAGRRL